MYQKYVPSYKIILLGEEAILDTWSVLFYAVCLYNTYERVKINCSIHRQACYNQEIHTINQIDIYNLKLIQSDKEKYNQFNA